MPKQYGHRIWRDRLLWKLLLPLIPNQKHTACTYVFRTLGTRYSTGTLYAITLEKRLLLKKRNLLTNKALLLRDKPYLLIIKRNLKKKGGSLIIINFKKTIMRLFLPPNTSCIIISKPYLLTKRGSMVVIKGSLLRLFYSFTSFRYFLMSLRRYVNKSKL